MVQHTRTLLLLLAFFKYITYLDSVPLIPLETVTSRNIVTINYNGHPYLTLLYTHTHTQSAIEYITANTNLYRSPANYNTISNCIALLYIQVLETC